MDIRPSSNPSPIHIEEKNAYRWRGGKRTVYDKNGIQVIVQTKSVAERLKESFAFSKKENRVYETVKLQIRDAQNGEIVEKNFTLSKFGMRARTKELESKLDEVLKNINSNEASSNPPPALGTSSPALQNLKPINAGTPQASTKPPTHTQDISASATTMNSGTNTAAPNPSSVSKTSTESSRPQSGGSVIPQPPPNTSIPIPTDATSAASGTTVTPEATISPELQTILNKQVEELTKEDATKLATAYGDTNVPDKQKLGEKLSELLDTLKGKLSDAATNPQEVKDIASAVSNALRGSLRKLNNSASEELKNLQKNASELSSKANRFNNVNTLIDNIKNGKQQTFEVYEQLKLKQAAMDTNFPRHEEALQALMSVVSQSCEKIQKEGFLSEAKQRTHISYNPISHLKYANDALKEIFAKNPSTEFTQLQDTIRDTISNTCQEFCGAKDFSEQDITNLNTLKYTLPEGTPMPENMQNAFNKATTELCGRIQGNLKPDTDDVAMLKSIHNALNDDSAECQAIEKTFFENLEAIKSIYPGSRFSNPEASAAEAIAQKHANRLSAKEVTELANEYTQPVAALGAQTGNLKAKLPADTSASVPIQNLSKEELKKLDEETFKNLPDDAEKLTPDALQDLLDQTSIEDMTRYAEVYAAGFTKRQRDDKDQVESKLNVIAQAVGQKLLKGADQISSDDVQKLQVLIDKSRAYNLNINQSIQTATEAQLRVIQTLQYVQRNTTNSAIDNAFTLIDAYRQYPDNDIFRQAIDQASASNVESACKIFVGNLDQFTGNARKLIDLYDKLPNNSPARGIIRKTFADHHQEIQNKLTARGTATTDELQTLERLQEIANQTT